MNSRHEESSYILPVLRVLYINEEPCSMTTIKNEVADCLDFELTSEDLAPYPSRKSTEESYRQIVGNLISHKKEKLFRYLDVLPDKSHKGRFLYAINAAGIEYIEKMEKGKAKTQAESHTNVSVPAAVFEAANMPVLAGMTINKTCNFGIICRHRSIGKPYRIVPTSAAAVFFPIDLHVPENIMFVCDACKEAFEGMKAKDKQNLIKEIYSSKKNDLRKANIYISEKELIDMTI